MFRWYTLCGIKNNFADLVKNLTEQVVYFEIDVQTHAFDQI